MIEVLDIQKNMQEGTEIIKKKYKSKCGAKGFATIELFEGNRLVQETITNNFITNPLDKKYLYADISKQLGSISTASVPRIDEGIRFGQIQLRSGDFEEDIHEKFIKGDLVGWCPRLSTETTTDVKRGTYNPNESYTEFTKDGYYHCHLVYDFSTSQANGTFNHIYWNYAGSTDYPITTTTELARGYWNSASYKGMPIDAYIDAFGEIAIRVGGQYYKLENPKEMLNGISTTPKFDTSKPINFIPSKYSVEGDKYVTVESRYLERGNIEERESTMTIYLRDKQGNIVKQKDINILDIEAFNRMNNQIGTNMGYIAFNYLKFVGRDGKIYFSIAASCRNSYAKPFPKFDENGNLIENSAYVMNYLLAYDIINDTWVYEPNPYNEIKTSYDYLFLNGDSCTINYNIGENEYIAYSAKYICKYKLDKFEFEGLNYIKLSTNDTYYDKGVDFKRGLIFGGYDGYTSYRYILPYTSHTKLPNPVTKTDKNTMRLSYDYYIQIPDMHCCVEGEEFNWSE